MAWAELICEPHMKRAAVAKMLMEMIPVLRKQHVKDLWKTVEHLGKTFAHCTAS